MNGNVLAQTILSGDAGQWLVCFALLVFSGVLRPLARSAPELFSRRGPDETGPDATPDDAVGAPVTLSSIELALIAELSLEQARDHEVVARDMTQRFETRRKASEAAAAWRSRAATLHLEARRRSGQPMVPGRPARESDSTYAGPERRSRPRRSQTRGGAPPGSSDGLASRDRRTGLERRSRDRRDPELAPR